MTAELLLVPLIALGVKHPDHLKAIKVKLKGAKK